MTVSTPSRYKAPSFFSLESTQSSVPVHLPPPNASITQEASSFWQIYEALESLRRVMSERQEIPETFDLRPLKTRQVRVKVRKREPAPFYLVTEEADIDR